MTETLDVSCSLPVCMLQSYSRRRQIGYPIVNVDSVCTFLVVRLCFSDFENTHSSESEVRHKQHG